MSSFSLLRSFSSDQSQQATPAKRKPLNKRFSFHHKQHHNVKETTGVEDSLLMMGRNGDKKTKALTRRWSSLKQYQTTAASQQSLATGSAVNGNSSTSNVSANATGVGESMRTHHNSSSSSSEKQQQQQHPSEVKKKWEVIEHYKGAIKGRETISSSLLAVSVLSEQSRTSRRKVESRMRSGF